MEGNRAKDEVLEIPNFKGVIEVEEIIREIGRGPEAGTELCQESQKRLVFQ